MIRIGRCAASLPAPADLRRMVGWVAHTFATPLPQVWEMELSDLAAWMAEAAEMYRMIYGKGRR